MDNLPSYTEYIFNTDGILMKKKDLAVNMFTKGKTEAYYSEKTFFEYYDK